MNDSLYSLFRYRIPKGLLQGEFRTTETVFIWNVSSQNTANLHSSLRRISATIP